MGLGESTVWPPWEKAIAAISVGENLNASALPTNDIRLGEQEQKQIVLFGRFMLPDMSEHPCQIANLTTESAVFLTNLDVPAGVQVVAYIDELGRIEGQISEQVPSGFRVNFSLTASRLERFKERLDWVKNKDTDTSIDHRRHDRFGPSDSKSHITLPDGRVYPCEVVDISLSGAAVTTAVMPSLGTYVMLGKMRGRVVRYIENGVGIEFAKQLDPRSVPVQST